MIPISWRDYTFIYCVEVMTHKCLWDISKQVGGQATIAPMLPIGLGLRAGLCTCPNLEYSHEVSFLKISSEIKNPRTSEPLARYGGAELNHTHAIV